MGDPGRGLWLVMLIPLLVVGGSPGCDLSKGRVAIGVPARGSGGVEGSVRAGRVVRSGVG